MNVLVLLALGGDGKPASHEGHAQSLASMGIPVLACTPDLFPDLMATALKRHDIAVGRRGTTWCSDEPPEPGALLPRGLFPQVMALCRNRVISPVFTMFLS